jgi:hypothetical protein
MDTTSSNYTFPYLEGTLRLHQHSFKGCNNKVSKSYTLQHTRQSQLLNAVFILSTRVQYYTQCHKCNGPLQYPQEQMFP